VGTTPAGGTPAGGTPAGGTPAGGTPAGGTPPSNDAGWPAASTALEDQVLVETNARRAQGANCGGQVFGPAGPLVAQPQLRRAARLHSLDMATRNFFDHTTPEGRTVSDRLKAAGYPSPGSYGENIAAGPSTAREVVDMWVQSPGHCSNLMDPGYHLLGVGYAAAQGGNFSTYWTQDFGS
jgi:uncharacterized protein YkwD